MRRTALVLLLFALVTPSAADAQTRRRRPSRPATSAPAPAATAVTAERQQAARRLADQVTDLTRFLYVLGGTVKTLEAAEASSRGRDIPPETARQTETSRAKAREAFRNVRVSIDAIENDFSSKPALRPYFAALVGATSAAEQAEQLAASNKFDQAGRALFGSVAKLTQALVAMGNPALH